MQLEQQFILGQPPDATWPAFADVALLVGCLPGASLTGGETDGQWPMRFDVRLGPVAASFTGQGRLVREDATRSGRFEGQASDRRTGSRVKGSAAFTLAAHESGTRVIVQVDYALTGALAQVGRAGIVRELAGALTAQFAANLEARLGERAATVATDPATAPGAQAEVAIPTAADTPVPLAGGALLWQALRRWLAGILSPSRKSR